MELNTDTEDMSKSIFTIITLAAIFSMSTFAHAFAESEEAHPSSGKNKHLDTRTHVRHVGDDGSGGSGDKGSSDTSNTDNNNNDNTPKVIRHTDRSDNDNHGVKQTTTTVSPTVPNGFNATFFDANTPYCWYVVNAPPCYDLKTGTIIH
jgi:hypothetical protein